METSSYSAYPINQKLIPSNLLGIIFSNAFDKLKQEITGISFSKNDNIDTRMKFLRSVRLISDIKTYFAHGEKDRYEYPAILENEMAINGSLIIMLDDMYWTLDNDLYPMEPISFWHCVSGNKKRSIKNYMRTLTAKLSGLLYTVDDKVWAEDQIDEYMYQAKQEGNDEGLKDIRDSKKRIEYFRSMTVKYKKYSLSEKIEMVKKYDKNAFRIFSKYSEYIERFFYEFKLHHFTAIEDEYNDGMININDLIFNLVDINSEESIWTNILEQEIEIANNSGVTNTLSSFVINDNLENGYLYNSKSSFRNSSFLFEKVKDFYKEIEKYIKDETN